MFYNKCEQKISFCSGNSQLVPQKKKNIHTYILNEPTHPQVMQILVAFYYFPGIQYFKLLVMSNDKEL